MWNNKPLVLQLDHINGVSSDNRIENLRIVCPNCHTQTITYARKHVNLEKPVYTCVDCGTKIEKNPTIKRCRNCYELMTRLKNPDDINRKIGECQTCGIKVRKTTLNCIKCHRGRGKNERPTTEEIIEELKTQNVSQVARKYNVSDACIRY